MSYYINRAISISSDPSPLQRQGIAEAKKRGVRFGRPRRKMPPEFAEAVDMVRCGEISGREAAQLCGMSYSTFREWMRDSKTHAEDRDLSLK